MATKKNTKKQQQTKSKRAAGSRMTPMKKSAKKKPGVKKPAVTGGTSKNGLTKEKSAKKRAVVKTKSDRRKVIGAKNVSQLKKQVRRKSQTVRTVALPREGRGLRSGEQSGDLQGLSSIEGPDSESVAELLEEGNAFEADVVKGVEDAGDADERDVHTREVPEDDVPEEYLNNNE